MYKVGSNQYQVKRKLTLEGFAALIIFILLMVYVFTANEVSVPTEVVVTPAVAQTEYAVLPTTTPTPSKYDEFMKRQVKINQMTIEWMHTQEFINKEALNEK